LRIASIYMGSIAEKAAPQAKGIDYRCEDRKNDIGDIRYVLTPSIRKPRSASPKNKPFSQDIFWRYCFSAEVWNCQILNQVVESQLFISLWNRYHRWLSDMELIQTSAFSASYPRINPGFTAGKRFRCLKLSQQLVDTGKRPSSRL
jgi:hypothetical protein